MAKILDFKANNTTPSAGALTNVIGPDWNVVRNSISTYIDLNGVMQDAAANVPAIDYELGYPRTISYTITSNYVTWTERIDRIGSPSNATLSAVLDPRGTLFSVRITNTSGLAGEAFRYSAQTVSTGVSYIASFWARKNSPGVLSQNDVGINYYNNITPGNFYFGDQLTEDWKRFEFTYDGTADATDTVWKYLIAVDCEIDFFGSNATDTAGIAPYIAELDGTVPETREADVITNTVPAGTAPITMTTWIDGVSDGGQVVNQGDPITMLNGTTSIEIDDSASGSTTTVEIEWIDSTSAAATGNKIYRDDVEIADIANGVQFYSDPTAPVGTESKYEVQAHDGAGDETTQEVEGENMDYITTASAGVDYFPQDNAAALSDDNSRGSWDNSRTQIEPIQGDATEGVNSIEMTVTATGSQRGELTVTGLTIGQSYTFTWDHKAIPSSANPDIRVYNWTGLVTGPNISDVELDTTWTSKTFTGEASATSVLMRFYTQGGALDGTGDKLIVDKFRVTDA